MSKAEKLIAVISDNKAEVEWAIANQSLAGLDSSTRQAVNELVGSFNSVSKERRKWAKKALKKLPRQARKAIEQVVKLQDNVKKSREKRAEAIRKVAEIGHRGEDLETIIPVLIQSLKEAYPVTSASEAALANIGSPAVPLLITVLSDEPTLRGRISAILGEIGNQAKPALPALIKALSDPEEEIRNSAARAIEKIGTREEDIPLLIAALADEKAVENAAVALGKMGQLAKEAISALLEAGAKQKAGYQVKENLKAALVKIGPADIGAVTQGLSQKKKEVRSLAAEILSTIGSKAKSALPVLVKALGDPEEEVRSKAAVAIDTIGAREEDIPYLVEALSDKSEWVRSRTSSALAKLGTPAVPALIECLGDRKSAVRVCAAEALGEMGAQGKEALPHLVKALKDRSAEVQKMAVTAVGRLGPEAKDTVPQLIEFLKSEDLRRQAVSSLGRIGDARAVAPLLELLFTSHGGYGGGTLLEIAPSSAISKQVMQDAIEASSYEHLYHGYQYDAGYISLEKSDAAVKRLCDIKSPVTSNILHLVSQKTDIMVTMDTGCSKPWDEKVDFGKQRQMALDELARRGSPPHEPVAFIKISDKEREELQRQSIKAQQAKEMGEFRELSAKLSETHGNSALKAAQQISSQFKNLEAFRVLVTKLAGYRSLGAHEHDTYTGCLRTIAEVIGEVAIPELTPLFAPWPLAAATVLGAVDDPGVVPPLRSLLEHPDDGIANVAVSALGAYAKRSRNPEAIKALKWAAAHAKPSLDGRAAGRYEWAEYILKEMKD